jgi:hypothetical protein
MKPILHPLCDADGSAMSEVVIDFQIAGSPQQAFCYKCTGERCRRHYNETAGYFDLHENKTALSNFLILCEDDAYAMFLAQLLLSGNRWWVCPHCGSGLEV